MKDELGDRMKMWEKENTPSVMPTDKPIVARLDGRSFSKFTRGMNRPYDSKMSNCMFETMKHLVDHTGAYIGYTQSDEITLIWLPTDGNEIWFGGKLQKMVSNLASQATLKFNEEIRIVSDKYEKSFIDYLSRRPTFDARVWFVPSLTEATNVLWWREKDATKNAISMAAMAEFSHKSLNRKTSEDKLQMLKDKNINFEYYPEYFRRGAYLTRKKVTRQLNPEEFATLPEKHHARLNPELEFERTELTRISSPFPVPLKKISPVVDELFGGEPPIRVEYVYTPFVTE